MSTLTKDLESLFQRLSALSDSNDRLIVAALPVHGALHQSGGADALNVGGLSGRLVDSQFITVQNSVGTVLGQAHTLKVIGQANVSVDTGAKLTTIEVLSPTVLPATASQI